MNYRKDFMIYKLKMVFIFLIILLLLLVGSVLFYIAQSNAHKPLIILEASIVIFFDIIMTSAWMGGSSLIVKGAIDAAHKANHKLVYQLLVLTWIPPFPSTRYNHIIKLLRSNCLDPHKKPETGLEFSKYILKDDFGLYTLTYDGKEKMTEHVDSGVFSGRLSKIILSSPVLKYLLLIIVVCKLGSFIINLINHH